MYYKRLPEIPPAPEREAFQIRNYDPPVPSGTYCHEALAEYLTDTTMAHDAWEDWIVIQALIKKGALRPSGNAPA